MHTALRSLVLHIICSNIIGVATVQAAATSDDILEKVHRKALAAQEIHQALYDKLVVPRVRTENVWGLSHATAYNPSCARLFIAAAAPPDYSSTYVYRIQTFDPQQMFSTVDIPLPPYNTITALGFDRNFKTVALTASFKQVCLRYMARPEPPIFTIHNPDVIACTMTPSASVIALCCYNQMENIQRFIIYSNQVISAIIPSTLAQKWNDIITVCALSGDGSLLACGTDGGRIIVTRTAYPFTEFELKADAETCYTALAWSPNNAMLAASFTHGKIPQKYSTWCRLLCAQTGKSLHCWQTKDLVTASSFIDNDALALCTSAKKVYMHCMPLPLPVRMKPISALLHSAERKLCRRTAACKGPLILQTQQEHNAYKLLPPLLQQPWLFTLAPLIKSDAPPTSSSD